MRYNLVVPDDIFSLVQREANKRGITIASLLRKFIKLGLFILEIQENPNKFLVIREGNKEKEIVIF